jgi:hypothetical protein
VPVAFSPTVSFLNGLILIILNKKDPVDIISKFTVGSEEGISDLIPIIDSSLYALQKEYKNRTFSTSVSLFWNWRLIKVNPATF